MNHNVRFLNPGRTLSKEIPAMIFMRGLPGSGKSHLAAILTRQPGLGGLDATVISTDDYFVAGKHYLYDHTEIALAHEWNYQRGLKLVGAGIDVVVDNVHNRLWQMAKLARMANSSGWAIGVCEVDTHWAKAPEVCFQRQTHGCPLQQIHHLAGTWEELPTSNSEALAAILRA